jgi:hypothetical protein
VISLYLGKTSEPEVRAAATKGVDDKTGREQACEAAFYIAEYDLVVRHALDHPSERAAAVALLREAADTCPPGFIERTGAVAELKRL